MVSDATTAFHAKKCLIKVAQASDVTLNDLHGLGKYFTTAFNDVLLNMAWESDIFPDPMRSSVVSRFDL